ncbi:hypothetical protein PSQ19_07580 [Devosia algicola]|uniref:Uncharacterized protein n=1 Tax=Devosia algicola TaxID=3026418 RepID=A0ABY7YRW7_9HYPH|nr:hypothetical protein PSQ19_07580 [Devosia algicola]
MIGKVYVTGLGFANEMVGYVKSGAVPAFAIWNMVDVGYTTVYAAKAVVDGEVTGATGDVIHAGRMGDLTVGDNSTAVMGELFVYDKTNVQEAADLIASLQK